MMPTTHQIPVACQPSPLQAPARRQRRVCLTELGRKGQVLVGARPTGDRPPMLHTTFYQGATNATR